ncbi:DinB family protein [Algoriphagus resistens]|uniref:DinB family protein n=1 Tax=Algoriphagus resistens TaxID=1750590 RepID=UPI000AB9ABB6|nr:DinB family protein [Algoriphagus resistens]
MNVKPLEQVKLINEIETFHQDLDSALSRFSAETLNAVPFQGSWTAGQVAEHIIKSQLHIIAPLSEGLTSTADRLYDQEVNTIQEIFRDKESKAKTDKSIAPGPPPHKLKALLGTLQKQKEQQIEIIKTKKLEGFSVSLEFPGIGKLSRYEWIHMMIEHGQRHRRQIDTIYGKLH